LDGGNNMKLDQIRLLKEYIVAYKRQRDGFREKVFLCKLCGIDDNGDIDRSKEDHHFSRVVRHVLRDHGVELA